MLERENDKYLSDLQSQVAGLKSLTIDIEAEVTSQNQFLSNEMESKFGGATELLNLTMNKLGVMIQTGSRHMWYLALFIIFIFILLWWYQ